MPAPRRKKSPPSATKKSRPRAKPIAVEPTRPPDARSVIARVFVLLDRWLTLYEGSLTAAELVPREGLTPKLPDAAAAKELLSVSDRVHAAPSDAKFRGGPRR
jgi:hypothetical protein